MEVLSLTLLLLIAIITFGIYLVKSRFSYWENRGVSSIKGCFPYGNIYGLGTKYHIHAILDKLYEQLKHNKPFSGIYFFFSPVVLVTDLELVKNVLVKDFQYFQGRGMYINEKDDPLSANMFALEGIKWKILRTKLSPTFTSGKMKMMFPTIKAVGEQFRDFLSNSAAQNKEIEMKDILCRFTTDVIGSCAFGIDCNSLKDPDAKFRIMGKKIFENPRYSALAQFLIFTFQDWSRYLGIKLNHDDVEFFFMNAVRDTVTYREENNFDRPDFLSLLIKLKNIGNIEENNSTNNKVDQNDKLTFNELAAQAFLFFIAGFETSSTAMSYALYELSLNQEAQEKARQCVRDVLKKHDGEMTYEAILEMSYIDYCINESLRKYPPLPFINRICNKDYTVPNTDLVIEKDTGVFIPVHSIHHDPQYYPEPEKYIPERFLPEEVATRNPYTFLPFGEGPRVCIGLRFGMMQARIGLAILLNDFQLEPCSKSDIPLKLRNEAVLLTPSSGLWFNIKKLDK